ncbi:MAG TPA: tRNA epoxyqueuosine(34) reductase QueG, partial [Acidimicrobiales bacterium]|nr:tRNA epoxyqueuosine(34) reductase QueG [Acidimicrobiales bacterium]
GGLDGGMPFTYRNPARATDPGATVAGAQALVVGARAYGAEEPPRPQEPAGRVARYAWSDHYTALRSALRAVAVRLKVDGWRAVVVADENNLVDREAAYRAGLGWYGKNANLLLPGRGSWFVLGSVVTDAPLDPTRAPVADGCGSCRRCLDGCPTGAIVAPGVVDARRCLAWLVQQPGTFPVEYRAALGDRIYGCDDCQEVCPPNGLAQRTGRSQARPDGQPVEAWVPLVELLTASDAELLARHGRWYIAGRDPRWLRRNALVALGNVAHGSDPAVAAVLRAAIAGPDPMLREHAAWAAERLESSSPAAAALRPAPTRSARQSVLPAPGSARQSRTPPIPPAEVR